MSADMMVICEEDNSNYEGDTDKAVFIDETSMGDPWHDFGKWFQSRFCGAPGLLEQLAGVQKRNYTVITGSDVVAVSDALDKMECHGDLDKGNFVAFMKGHVDKHISTENW